MALHKGTGKGPRSEECAASAPWQWPVGDCLEETKPRGETVHVPERCGHGTPPGVAS